MSACGRWAGSVGIEEGDGRAAPQRRTTRRSGAPTLWVGVGIALLLLAGCRTTAIPTFEPVPVPEGLSEQDVELAIVLGIAGTHSFNAFATGDELTVEDLERSLELARLTNQRRSGWYVRTREPRRVEAEFRHGQHRLLVGLTYDEKEIRAEILDSRRLRQSSGRIHKSALKWTRDFLATLPGSLRFVWKHKH